MPQEEHLQLIDCQLHCLDESLIHLNIQHLLLFYLIELYDRLNSNMNLGTFLCLLNYESYLKVSINVMR